MVETLVIGLAAFIGLFTQRVLGFGTGAFLVPAMLLYTTAPTAVVTAWLTGAIITLSVLFSARHNWAVPFPVLWRLLAAAVPGLLIGLFLLITIDKAWLQIIIGLSVIFGIYVQDHVFGKPRRRLAVSRGIGLSGFAAGLLGALAAMAPPALLLYLRTHKVTPDQVRQLMSAVFLLMNLVVIPGLILLKPETIGSEALPIFLKLIPVIALAIWLGGIAAKNLNTKIYHRLVSVTIYVTAIVTIGLGVNGLS